MKFIEKRIERLQELKGQRPQYQEIFVFYETLFRFLQGEEQSFLSASFDPAEQHRKGFPLLTGTGIAVEEKKTADFLLRLTGVLKEHGEQGKDELERLQQALSAGKIDLQSLFSACLDRRRKDLEEGATQADIPSALLEYVLDTALSFALQKAREEGLDVPVQGWEEGYCPLCGSVPSMAELTGEEGTRRLHCAVCTTEWKYPRRRCAACGNSDPESLEYFTAEGDTGHRVDVCRKCSSYLKVADSRLIGDQRPMDLEDIATLHLDLLAQQEGFTRGKRNL